MSSLIETITHINDAVNGVVWGPIMLTMLIGTGLLLSIRMKFPQFTKFGYVMKNTIGSLFNGKQHHKDSSGVSPFQAVSTAMYGAGRHHRHRQYHRYRHGFSRRRSGSYLLDVDKRLARYGHQIFGNHPRAKISREKRQRRMDRRPDVLH